MNAQFITTPSGERLVVLAEKDFERLVEAAKDAIDIAAIESFKQELADGTEELVPAEFVHRLLDGENPIRVWREYRDMQAKELAAAADITGGYLSEIESGQKQPSVATLQAIAKALKVTVDDLLVSNSD
jgi:DNA-binding XRE family transcriptional regulator